MHLNLLFYINIIIIIFLSGIKLPALRNASGRDKNNVKYVRREVNCQLQFHITRILA